MARVIWKGAVSFGLVHIPVSLLPATNRGGVDFDWLDRRSMDPVGYKRINKTTGKEISSENIVRGVQYEKHRYVVLEDEEIRAAYPEATQTVDIVSFVDSRDIPPMFIDTPYYLAPERRGEKVYALLREALRKTGRAGLARVVLHSRQRLAVLLPVGPALVLNTLRWAAEVRGIDEIGLKAETLEAGVAKKELDMATQLIEGMSEDWAPAQYSDSFEARIMELVERKARAGKLETVESGRAESKEGGGGADVIDLAELLKRSLAGKGKPASAKSPARATEGETRSRRSTRRKAG